MLARTGLYAIYQRCRLEPVLTKFAADGGLDERAKIIPELYLDLAKPVIEVGAAKKVPRISSEGKELAIKNFGNEA